MITFRMGELPDEKNATVTLGEIDHDAFAERDAEGNIAVTLDTNEPDTGDPVSLCLHDENDATYAGEFLVRDDALVFLSRS